MDIFAEGIAGNEPYPRFKEVITPHKLSILILVYEYCVMKIKSTAVVIPRVFGEVPENTNELTQKEVRNFMISTLKLLQSSDVDLEEFLAKQTPIMNATLLDTVKQRLKEIYYGGIQPLTDFFDPLSKLLDDHQPVMTNTSVLGVFVRRMVLAYERLSFSQVIQLYDKFRVYYEQCPRAESMDSSCNTDAAGMSESMTELSAIAADRVARADLNPVTKADANCIEHDTTGGFYSQKQAEYFIVMQGFRMQYNENEALPAKELQERITEMLRANPDLAEAHFLSYLNCMRVREFCTALHNLHHYFDRHAPTSTGDATNQNKPKDEDASRRFAALNLASLHYRFGHRGEALAALDEAIRMAQESNDHVCLQHALGWLYRLSEPGTQETGELLERSVVKTQEHNLPYLASLGVQAFARHSAFSSAIPSSIFEFLVKSDVLNCQYSQSGSMCVSCVHKAGLWQMYGKSESSLMYNQLALNLETSDCGLYYNGELSCIALCNLAKCHARKGDWASTSELLRNAKRLFPSHTRYAHIWMSCEQEVNITRAMYCGNWAAARQAVQNLKAVKPEEAEIREAALLKDTGETTAATMICEKLLKKCSEDTRLLPEFKCRVYMLLGQLHCETGCYASAVSPLLDCVCLARTHHLSYTLALASSYTAYVQLCMSLPAQAVKLLERHLITILTNGSLYDRARVTSLYVKCRLAESLKDPPEERTNVLRWAVSRLDEVVGMFRAVDATIQLRNSLYFVALLHHRLGNTAERNQASNEFKKLDQLLPNMSPVTAKSF